MVELGEAMSQERTSASLFCFPVDPDQTKLTFSQSHAKMLNFILKRYRIGIRVLRVHTHTLMEREYS